MLSLRQGMASSTQLAAPMWAKARRAVCSAVLAAALGLLVAAPAPPCARMRAVVQRQARRPGCMAGRERSSAGGRRSCLARQASGAARGAAAGAAAGAAPAGGGAHLAERIVLCSDPTLTPRTPAGGGGGPRGGRARIGARSGRARKEGAQEGAAARQEGRRDGAARGGGRCAARGRRRGARRGAPPVRAPWRGPGAAARGAGLVITVEQAGRLSPCCVARSAPCVALGPQPPSGAGSQSVTTGWRACERGRSACADGPAGERGGGRARG
jgi:hypothetical protein